MEQGDRTVSFPLSDVDVNVNWECMSWGIVINSQDSNFNRWMDIVDETESLIDFLDQIQEMDYGERESGGMSVNDMERPAWETCL